MYKLTAIEIFEALEQSVIKVTRERGNISLAISGETVLQVPEFPPPVVILGVGGVVLVTSDDLTLAMIDTASPRESSEVADVLNRLFAGVDERINVQKAGDFVQGLETINESLSRIHDGCHFAMALLGLAMATLVWPQLGIPAWIVVWLVASVLFQRKQARMLEHERKQYRNASRCDEATEEDRQSPPNREAVVE